MDEDYFDCMRLIPRYVSIPMRFVGQSPLKHELTIIISNAKKLQNVSIVLTIFSAVIEISLEPKA